MTSPKPQKPVSKIPSKPTTQIAMPKKPSQKAPETIPLTRKVVRDTPQAEAVKKGLKDIKKDTLKTLSVALPADQVQKFKSLVYLKGHSIQDVVQDLVEDWIKKNQK